MWALHHNPKYFGRPDDFAPERWLGDQEFKNDRLDAVKPFSIGPRNCIGMKYVLSPEAHRRLANHEPGTRLTQRKFGVFGDANDFG